ncbi:MAG: hypothetical protein Fur005_24370 [Roseiflexaceae bacterium]
MANKHPEIVQPGGSIQHIIVVYHPHTDLGCQGIHSWLMAIFIDRLGVFANIFGDGLAIELA